MIDFFLTFLLLVTSWGATNFTECVGKLTGIGLGDLVYISPSKSSTSPSLLLKDLARNTLGYVHGLNNTWNVSSYSTDSTRTVTNAWNALAMDRVDRKRSA